MTSPSNMKIAIIGGGPAGLTLGLLLHKNGIPFTIFELTHRPTEKELEQPAGSLDMHKGSGLAAIRECGLYDEFQTLTGDCSEAQRVFTKEAQLVYEDDGGPRERPEISRHKLIKMLLDQLPASTIKWSHKLLIAKRTESGMELDFGVNGIHTFDFVIGADGAWSKIRKLLTDVKPHYAGIQNITLNIRNITTRYPHLAELIGDGTFSSLGNKHGVFSQRSVQDSARIYIFLTARDEQFGALSGLKSQTPVQAKEYLLSDTSPLHGWSAIIRELVEVACDDEGANNQGANLNIKPLYMLPVGHTWQHQPGLTLIGDAAHLMCPWAGEGVNLAMKDSLFLSKAIVKAYGAGKEDSISIKDVLDVSIREFEAKMLAGAKETAEETLANGEMMFGSDDGAAAMRKFFETAMPPPSD